MDSKTYQSLSLRTVPAPLMFWTLDGEAADHARSQLFCNCALGLAGEAAEIHEAPTSDEIGDGYWYSYTLFRVLDADPIMPKRGTANDAHTRAYRSAGAICELAKKHLFHGRSFDDVRGQAVELLREYVNALASLDPQSAEATFDQNVEKLRSRYPEGFFERG